MATFASRLFASWWPVDPGHVCDALCGLCFWGYLHGVVALSSLFVENQLRSHFFFPSHRFDMRQLTAASVLLALLSLWGLPVVSAFTGRLSEDNLPACCRRNGKHHCMMQMAPSTDSRPAFSGTPQHCPLFPKGVLPGPTRLNLFAPAPSATFFAAVQSHPAFAAQTEARYRIAFDRSRLKRGPPRLI